MHRQRDKLAPQRRLAVTSHWPLLVGTAANATVGVTVYALPHVHYIKAEHLRPRAYPAAVGNLEEQLPGYLLQAGRLRLIEQATTGIAAKTE